MFSYKLDEVCDLLEWKHHNFFQVNNVESKGVYRDQHSGWHMVRDNFTGAESVHDFPEHIPIKEYLAQFRQRVDILGFINDIASSENAIIVRYNLPGESLKSIIRLNDVIHHMRRGKPYSLIVFQNKIALPAPFRVPNLEIFDCPDWEWVWQGEWFNGEWVGPEEIWRHILICKNVPLLL